MRTVKLNPKTTLQSFDGSIRYFSVHNLSWKDKVHILLNKRIWFEVTKGTAERIAR